MRKLIILLLMVTMSITFNGLNDVQAYQYSDSDINWTLNSKRFLYDDEPLSVTLLSFNENILANYNVCIAVYRIDDNGTRQEMINGICNPDQAPTTLTFNFNQIAVFDEHTFIKYEVVTELYYFDQFNSGGPLFSDDAPTVYPMFRGTVIKRPPSSFYVNPTMLNNLSVGVNTSVYSNTNDNLYLFETATIDSYVTSKGDFAIIHYRIPESNMNIGGLEEYNIYINDIVTGNIVATINIRDFIYSQFPDTGPQTILNSFNNGYIFVNLNGDSSSPQFFSFINGSILVYYLEAITYGDNPYRLNVPIGVYTFGITDNHSYYKQGETPFIVSQFGRELIDVSFRSNTFPLGGPVTYRVRRFEQFVWEVYNKHDLIINGIDYSSKYANYRDIIDITFTDNINTTTNEIEHFFMSTLDGPVNWGLSYSQFTYDQLLLFVINSTYINTSTTGVGELPNIVDDDLALGIFDTLAAFNLNDENGKFMISLFIYMFVLLGLIVIKANNSIYVFAILFITAILTVLTFIPLWFVVLMAFIIAYGLFKAFNKGGDSVV